MQSAPLGSWIAKAASPCDEAQRSEAHDCALGNVSWLPDATDVERGGDPPHTASKRYRASSGATERCTASSHAHKEDPSPTADAHAA